MVTHFTFMLEPTLAKHADSIVFSFTFKNLAVWWVQTSKNKQ